MTKQEFLTELQRALTNRMSAGAVAGHVNYYREYIEVEVRKGKSEEEVTTQLGNPRLIAKSILNASAQEQKKVHTKEADAGNKGNSWNAQKAQSTEKMFFARFTGWLAQLPVWMRILLGVILVLALGILGIFLMSLAGILIPVLFPLILIFLLIRWWKKR